MRLLQPRPSRHLSAGMSMIEILVAVVVLSFGLIGSLGLQMAAMRNNREARLQAQALQMGREIAELMRANNRVAGQTTASANPYLVSFSGSLPAITTNCFAGACASTADVAASDVREWLTRLNNTLPGARATICFDASPYDNSTTPPTAQWACSNTGDVVVVKIGWRRRTTNNANTNSDAGAADFAHDAATRPAIVLPVIAGGGA